MDESSARRAASLLLASMAAGLGCYAPSPVVFVGASVGGSSGTGEPHEISGTGDPTEGADPSDPTDASTGASTSGDDSSGTTAASSTEGADSGGDPCMLADVGPLAFAPASAPAKYTGVLDGDASGFVVFSFRTAATGLRDLAAPPNHTPWTCEQCLTVYDGAGRRYLPIGGTIDVSPGSTVLTGTLLASLSDAQLIEVEVDEVAQQLTPIVDGGCLRVGDAELEVLGIPGWTCATDFYGVDDGCDCGCGIIDPDCAGDSTVAACEYCDELGSCSAAACPGTIDPVNNAACV